MILTIEQLRSLTGLFGDVKYLAVLGRADDTTERVEPYLGFGAVMAKLSEYHALWIVAIPSRHAEWLRDRMGSGLIVASIHDTYNEAESAAVERAI